MGHNMSLRLKRLSRITLLAVFINLIFLFSPNITANAEGGIAISGSFARYHYKIIPGETISAPDIDIVVFNNNDVPIKMKFATNAPNGVKIDLEGKEIVIPAKGKSASFPVAVTVGKSVVPGEYEISVSADAVPTIGEGIAIVGAAMLRTKLSVFGEAGWVNINTITPEGDPFHDGEIHLFSKVGNGLSPVAFKRGSKMEERLIPGEYVVKVYFQGNEVGQESFLLKANEVKKITIQAKTVFIQGFAVTPMYSRASKEISSARVTYTLKNVYKPMKGARVVLKVYHKNPIASLSETLFSKLDFITQKVSAASIDNLLEEVEIATFPTLELGSQNGRYSYVPLDGWKSGTYSFVLDLYGINGKSVSKASVVYGESEKVEFKVEGNNTILFIIIILIIALIVYFVIRKKEWIREKLNKMISKKTK